jgi:hypothetical protein
MTMQLSGRDSLRAPGSTRLRFVVLAVILLMFGIVGPRFALAQVVGPSLGGDPAFPDCGRPLVNRQVEARSVSPVAGSPAAAPAADATKWRCIPPYQTPQYTPPGNDSVALSTLLEAAGVSWMDTDSWTGVAAGHFCDATKQQVAHPQKQLVIFANSPTAGSKEFGLLGWPTPFYIAGEAQGLFPSNFDSGNRIADWRAVTVGTVDNNSSYDEIVAVRHLDQPGFGDLAIGRIAPNCIGTSNVTTVNIADIPRTSGSNDSDWKNSDWVGVAVGNFDGSKKKRVAMLRTGNGEKNTQLVLVNLDSSPPDIYSRQDLDPDPSHPSAWKGLAAGTLDGSSGPDTLIAVRQVSDLKSPTVLVYKLASDNTFHVYATSNLGNDGNSDWAGVAVGDFNADGRKAIVLVKNKAPHFAVFDLPPSAVATPGIQELNTLAQKDLDSADGQNWTSIAAADWLTGDQGADELIAIRSVHSPYRTNVFVYGDPFHLATRNSALEGTKAQYDQLSPDSPGGQNPLIGGQQVGLANFDRLKQIMRNTHTNTFLWQLVSDFDYTNLVTFLKATKDFGVDGQQVRVWVDLLHPSAVASNECSLPENTMPATTWNALDYFASDFANGESPCLDMAAWAQVLGRLAQDFPHLVGVGIDDFAVSLNFGSSGDFSPDIIARMEANLRWQAPWMSLIPTTYHDLSYYPTPTQPWADIGLTLDTQLFYFRDQREFDIHNTTPCSSSQCLMAVNGNPSNPGSGSDAVIHPKTWGCLAGPVAGYVTGPCADLTPPNALAEFADMAKMLPAGRKMLGGVYFQGHSELGQPSAKYDYELTKMILSQPNFAGAVVYTLRVPPGSQSSEPCVDNIASYENPWDKYCTVWKVFGDNP